jgi:Tol biopolymer transport system component
MNDRDPLVARQLSAAVDDIDIDVEEGLSEFLAPGRLPQRRHSTGHRLVTTVVALAIAAAGLIFAGRALFVSLSGVGSGVFRGGILLERYSASPAEVGGAPIQIWSASEEATSATPLPQPAGSNEAAAYSPDGSRIAFAGTAAPSQPSRLWVMHADGSRLAQVAEGFGADQPAWSPNGKWIAFQGTQDPDGSPPGQRGIWIVAASGGRPRVALGGAEWEQPAWSPDGTRLVVVGNGTLFTLSVDGSNLTRITHDGAIYADPAWSPDGRLIACARWTSRNPWNVDIYVINADGSGSQQLTGWKGWDSSPVWSRDGSKLLFASDRGATPRQLALDQRANGGELGLGIYVMDADGKGVHPVFVDHSVNAVPTSWRR